MKKEITNFARSKMLILVLSLTLFCMNSLSFSQDGFPDLYGPYFGQQLPGSTAKIFAEGIISGNALHASPVFSPDGTEMYWAQLTADYSNVNILFSRMIDNKWTAPEIASFCSDYYDDNPIFSPDGQKLFFNSHRIINGTSKERIWYTVRQNDGSWSDALPADPVINDYHLHWQTSFDIDGILYFSSDRSPSYGGADIFYTEFADGHFLDPVNMGITINTDAYESMPFMDRAKRFILFCRWADIHICRRLEDGSWAEAENISADFPQIRGTCPQITPDEKYFFFTIINDLVSTVYWVDAQFIFDNYTDVDSDHYSPERPNTFELSQNYPNPFNPKTTIKYSISSQSNVLLKVYDLLGNEMATLVNETQQPGYYQAEFDAKSFSSGVYFYCLQVGSHNQIKKMTILK